MRYLRTNTACRLTVGPFLDKTDGITPKTALTVTNCHLTLMVDVADVPTLVLDAAATASAGNNDMVHVTNDDAGFYDLELTAAQTNYLGRSMLAVTDAANHLPVFHELMILPANIYDSMILGTDLFDVSLAQILGTALTETSAGYLAAAFKKALDVAAPGWTTASVNQTGDSYARLGAPTLASVSADIASVKGAVVAGVAAPLTTTGAHTLTTGTLISGTYADTYVSDGTYLIFAPGTPAVGGFGLNLYMPFLCGASQSVNTVTIRGFYSGGGARYCNVYVYNWVTAAWAQLSDSVSRMNLGTVNATYTYTLLPAHQKADGTVQIGFRSPSTTTGDRLNIDAINVNVATAGPTAGQIADSVYARMRDTVYANGVWIDTIPVASGGTGVAGTDIGVNGIPTSPVLTYADALVIAAALNVKRFYLKPDSDITLTQSHAYWRFIGKGYVRLGGMAIDDAVFEDCELITGVGTGDDADFHQCKIETAELGAFTAYACLIGGNITLIANKDYTLLGCCDSTAASTTPAFIYAAGAQLALRNWWGGVTVSGMVAGNTLQVGGAGRVVIASNCTGGTITIRGSFEPVTDQVSPGPFAGTITQIARYGTDQLVNLASGQLTFKKNVARANFSFPMFDSTSALKTGLTVTAEIRKDSGSFVALAGSVTEIGTTGWYTVNFAQAETNADTIAFWAHATGANPTCYTLLTQA